MADINAFQESVIRLAPGNFMGMQGNWSGIIGASSGGSDAILHFQRAAIKFVQMYKDEDPPDALAPARKELTGKIMVAHTLGAITESKADELLDEISELMKERT